MVKKLFISYSHVDTVIMQQIRDTLKACDYEVWTDTEALIPGTENWKYGIEQGIEWADVVLVLLSPDSKASPWVRKEIDYAEIKKRRIVAVLLRASESESVPFALAGMQLLDFTSYDAEKLKQICKVVSDTSRLTSSHPQNPNASANVPDFSAQEQIVNPSTNTVMIYECQYVEQLPIEAKGKNLVERNELLDEIHSFLREDKPTLLHGIGGVGKTSLAGQIAQDYIRKQEKFVVWVTVGKASYEQVIAAFFAKFPDKDAPNKLSPEYQEERISKIFKYLGTLLVLDDIWDEETFVKLMARMPDKMQLLLTSRLRLREKLCFIPVGELSQEQAIKLFYELSGQEDAKREDVLKLCQSLSMHALAIYIVSIQLRSGEYQGSIDEFLKEFKLADISIPSPNPAHKSLYLLFEMSLAAFNEDVEPLLKFMSQFVSAEFTKDFIEDLAKRLNLKAKALGVLESQGFLKISGEEYQLQGLFFAFLRQALADKEDKASYANAIVAYAREIVVDAKGSEDISLFDANLRNIFAAAEISKVSLKEEILELVLHLAHLRHFDNYPHNESLIGLLEIGLKIARTKQDKAAIDSLVGKRGNVYVAWLELEKALSAYEEALRYASTIQRRAILYSVIGTVYARKKEFDLAENSIQKAEREAEQVEDNIFTLSVISEHRGFCAYEQKTYPSSKDYYEQSLAYATLLGYKNRLFYPMQVLGVIEELLGNFDAAIQKHEDLLKLAIEMEEERLIAEATRSLAWDHHRAGNREKAKEYLHKAYKLFREELQDIVAANELYELMKDNDYL